MKKKKKLIIYCVCVVLCAYVCKVAFSVGSQQVVRGRGGGGEFLMGGKLSQGTNQYNTSCSESTLLWRAHTHTL